MYYKVRQKHNDMKSKCYGSQISEIYYLCLFPYYTIKNSGTFPGNDGQLVAQKRFPRNL